MKNMNLFLYYWLVVTLLILLKQLLGGGIPGHQSSYFYLGYFSTPIVLSFLITYISYQLLRLFRSRT